MSKAEIMHKELYVEVVEEKKYYILSKAILDILLNYSVFLKISAIKQCLFNNARVFLKSGKHVQYQCTLLFLRDNDLKESTHQ